MDGHYSRWPVPRGRLLPHILRWLHWAQLVLETTILLAMRNESSTALYFYSASCSLVYLWASSFKWFTILNCLTRALIKNRSLRSSSWWSETSSIKVNRSILDFKTQLQDFSILRGKIIETISCWAQKTSKFIPNSHVTAN